MKQIILIAAAVMMAVSAYAQYPNTTNKMRLGIQTTGDGLIYRHAGTPSWTPTGINNAWQSIDTLTGDLYTYRNGTWFLEVKGDLQQVYPVVINKSGVNIKRGEVVSVDTSQIVQGDQIRIMRAIGDGGLSPKLIMGVAATDINNNATGYVAWFGYVREAVEANIAETGVTLNVGDILYLSATEPGRLTNVEPTPPALKSTIALLVRKPSVNNLTLLVRPSLNEDLSDLNDVDLNGVGNGQTIVWDSINTKWIAGNVGSAIDTTTIATKFYVDSKVDSTRLTQDSILVYYIGGAEVGRDTLSLPAAGVTSITAGVGLTGGTITNTGTIAADTATVLATKTFLSTRGYITGSGTSGQVSYWNGTSSQTGSNNLFWDATNNRLGIGTTTPATPFTLFSSANESLTARIENTSTGNAAFSSLYVRNSTAGFAVQATGTGVTIPTVTANQGRLRTDSGLTGGLNIVTGGNNTLFFGTNDISRFNITGEGIATFTTTSAVGLPSGTTAQRPGTPSVGMARNNTTNNNLDFYTGTAWENHLKSSTATGLGTAGRVFYADANGRAAADDVLFWDAANNRLGVNNTAPAFGLDVVGTSKLQNSWFRTAGAPNIRFENTNITVADFSALGFAVPFTTNTVANISTYTVNQGGMAFEGFTTANGGTAMYFGGFCGNTSPGANPVTLFNSVKHNGTTSWAALAANEIAFQFNNQTNALARIYGSGNLVIGGTADAGRRLNVIGEARISDLTTDTPTRIVGADADGDLGAITVGSGLTLSGGTLTASGAGTTNLTFSGASSPVTLNSDTGTDVTLTAGDGISFSQTSNNLTISKGSPIYAVITVDSNRTSTFLAASVTPDTIDNPKLSQVGGVFSVVGNGIQYTSGTARTFLITANADFKFSEANNIVKFQGWRSNGGTVIDLGTFGTVESLLGNEIMHTSFTAITSLSNNDLLRFGFTPSAHTGDDTLVLTNLSITITQL